MLHGKCLKREIFFGRNDFFFLAGIIEFWNSVQLKLEENETFFMVFQTLCLYFTIPLKAFQLSR